MIVTRCFGTGARGPAVADVTLDALRPTLRASDVPEHAHVEPHFVLVARGAYRSIADGAPADGVDRPLVVFNPAGCVHRDCFHPAADLSRARFFSLRVGFGAWAHAADGLRLPAFAHALTGPRADCALHHAARVAADRDAAPLDLEGLAADLIAAFTQDVDARATHAPRWLAACKDALREQGADTLRPGALALLARHVGVHPAQLSRAFRRHERCTPGDYARRARVLRAATALTRTSARLADIAHEAGFADQAHMTRAFRAMLHTTPRRVREMGRA